MTFTHLHTHSHYSLLEAIPQIPKLVKTAKKFGMTSLALTDTNNLYGAIEFYKECKKAEIKPIIGCEVSVAERSMWEEVNTTTNRIFKLVLICENEVGYKNLLKLVSILHTEPKEKMVGCVDLNEIKKYKEGLIVLSGLNESYLWEVARVDFNLGNNYEKAKKYLSEMKEIFADKFFIEIGNLNEVEDGKVVRDNSIKLAKELDIEIVATYNSHYVDPGDRSAQRTIFGISNNPENKLRFKRIFEKGFYYFAPEADAKKHFSDIPEALENTGKIANLCNLEITLGKWVFPKFETESGKSYYDELKFVTYEGFKRRNLEQTKLLVERVEYELNIIENKGFTQYLLIVADLLKFARENGIASNIRGSVSGSLVTYLSGITNIDPIHFEIPFERFLNPDRPSAPDIDMDFEDTRRDEMVEYVKIKYGAERVAQIGTFGTMAARAACRDVARALGYPYIVGDKISKAVPQGSQGFPMTLERALSEDADFKKEYENNRETKEVVDLAMKIEGNARHMGVHAAGIVISPTTLDDYTPIQYDPKGERKIITQYDMYSIEDAGLIKFDFLGLSNLRIISDTLKLVKNNYNFQIDLDNLPLNDKLTFEKLSRGETTDLFQLNGTGMTRFLMELKPTIVNDINAMVALYRPGPLAYIPEYIKRKNNPELVTYMHPALEPILNKTFGVLVYQDDLLMMALKLAGYSWGEVDKFRKAVGKKNS
jgi:DNA polymerase-3 subunit alpha